MLNQRNIKKQVRPDNNEFILDLYKLYQISSSELTIQNENEISYEATTPKKSFGIQENCLDQDSICEKMQSMEVQQ